MLRDLESWLEQTATKHKHSLFLRNAGTIRCLFALISDRADVQRTKGLFPDEITHRPFAMNAHFFLRGMHLKLRPGLVKTAVNKWYFGKLATERDYDCSNFNKINQRAVHGAQVFPNRIFYLAYLFYNS